MKIRTLIAAAAILTVTAAHARTWTSADGSRTFEGELRSYDPGSGDVTVVVDGGRALTFSQDILSAEDIEFLKERKKEMASEPEAENPVEDSVVGKEVSRARLHRLEGDRYRNAELTKSPEYYILYYSASW